MSLKTYEQAGEGFIRDSVQQAPFTISSVARDVGNTGNTTLLRAGLALGRITATGELAEYTSAGTAGAGTTVCIGYLVNDCDLLRDGFESASVDRGASVLLLGTVNENNVIGQDAAGIVDLLDKIVHTDG